MLPAASALALAAAAPAADPPGAPEVIGEHAPDTVIVRARPGVAPLRLPDGRPSLAGRTGAAGAASLAPTLRRFGVAAIGPVFESGFADPALAARLGLDRCYRIRTKRGADVAALAAELAGSRELIERAELDPAGAVADLVPSDLDFGNQWGMLNTGQTIGGQAGAAGSDIDITPVWSFQNGNPQLILAVLDAGMDPHVEIAARMIPGRNVAAEPDNDDTSDVCISHGTHVAGIAAASGNNQQGVAGVDWRCRIMPVKVMTSCSGPESYLAEGLVWATDHGADVINMSLQYFTGSQLLHDAVLYADAQGVAMIAAAGNNGTPQVAFPARWPETIAVGAINNQGVRWTSSNGGPDLDVMGPGVNVWSLDATESYKFLTGTSMATPHVSGTVCLLRSIDPALPPAALREIVVQTAVDLDVPGFDEGTGHGLLDAHAAVLTAMGVVTPGDLDGDGEVGITDLLILLGAWGPCPGACPPACDADLNADCTVGITDLLALLAAWG